jgi:hypothetical protein
MKILPTFALIFAAVVTAHADVVIEQKVESATINGNMTMKIKGDQARIDTPSPIGQATTIMNGKTGEMTTLMHAQKMAVKMNINAMKQQAGLDASKMEKPKATGAKEKVGDWTADVYEFSANGLTGKIWAAKDYPNAQALKDELKKINSGITGSLDFSKMDVPGMVVKSQVNIPGAGAMTTTLISAKQQPVADSEFAIPTGYTEMKMPTAPGAAPK